MLAYSDYDRSYARSSVKVQATDHKWTNFYHCSWIRWKCQN